MRRCWVAEESGAHVMAVACNFGVSEDVTSLMGLYDTCGNVSSSVVQDILTAIKLRSSNKERTNDAALENHQSRPPNVGPHNDAESATATNCTA